jgi:hypothetical protein
MWCLSIPNPFVSSRVSFSHIDQQPSKQLSRFDRMPSPYLDQNNVCAGFGKPNSNSLPNASRGTSDNRRRTLKREERCHFLFLEPDGKINQ